MVQLNPEPVCKPLVNFLVFRRADQIARLRGNVHTHRYPNDACDNEIEDRATELSREHRACVILGLAHLADDGEECRCASIRKHHVHHGTEARRPSRFAKQLELFVPTDVRCQRWFLSCRHGYHKDGDCDYNANKASPSEKSNMFELAKRCQGASGQSGEQNKENGAGAMFGQHIETDAGTQKTSPGDGDFVRPESGTHEFCTDVPEDDSRCL